MGIVNKYLNSVDVISRLELNSSLIINFWEIS